MRILKLTIFLGCALICVTSRAQSIECGYTMPVASGGNVCSTCSYNVAYFVGNPGGHTVAMYGCASSYSCGQYQVSSSTYFCGVHNATKQTIQDKLLTMAIPRDLLINSCKGGLYPFKFDPAWFGADQTSKTLIKPGEGE